MNNEKNSYSWNWLDTILLLVSLIPVCFAIFRYEELPSTMASHFGASGQADGFQSKLSFLIWFSVLTVSLPFAMRWIRKVDPKRDNYLKFFRFYNIFRAVMSLFISSVFAVTLLYNLGYNVSIRLFILLALGIVWIIIGNFLGQVRSNYTFGIRTPWTIANEQVWRKTHRMAGPMWMFSGLLLMLSAFAGSISFLYVFGIALILSAVIPVIYSYRCYHVLKK